MINGLIQIGLDANVWKICNSNI